MEAKNKSQSMESYTSTISHEFRTPLGTALMFLESLLDTLTGEERRLVRMVIGQLNLLLCLVQGVLDINSIANDTYDPRLETFNPADAFKFIRDMFQLQV